jgi:HK97 family phage portal protein
VESGPVFDLFLRAGAQLWEATEGWRCMKGEAIWILGWGGQKGLPQQIVVVDPSDMQAKVSLDGTKVDMWFYTGRGQKIPFKPEEVLHFPMWNPYDPIRGMPELQPVLDELNQEYLMSKGSAKLLSNQSIPGGIITIPGDEMSEEQAEKVIGKWEKKHAGINRAGRVAVLGSGATYQKISLSPQEMQTSQAREWNRETILAKYGVPNAVVGLKSLGGTLSGKDTAEQMKAFWNLTLLPECAYFEKKLEEEFFKRFNISMSAEFDTTELWEMQADEELLSNRLRTDVQTGLMTINEARELKGMDPVEWGDTWWRPMGLVDVQEEPEPVPDVLAPFAGVNNPPKDEEDQQDEKPPKDMPMDEEMPEDKPSKSVASLFQKGRPSIYTSTYKDMRWKAQFDPVAPIEARYTKQLKSLFYKMRQEQLASLMEYGGQAAIQNSTLEALMDEPMWVTYNRDLEAISRANLSLGVDLTGKELLSTFGDLGLDVGIGWDIWDTRAKDLLEYRVNKVSQIDDTIRAGIREKVGLAIEHGWTNDETSDVLRDTFNIAQNRAPTIARTELSGAINDSRVEGFKEVGISRHEWLSSKDELVRDGHAIDGEVQIIGQTFSNGLRYPHDPAGDAGNVINCRCITLPVFEE